MRTTIKKLQRRLGITTVYVTHDQEEALAISDRIAVMNQGNIMQIGTPEEIYRKPANPFVANFIGVSNFIDCTIKAVKNSASVSLPGNYSVTIPVTKDYEGEAILSARPEQLFFDEAGIPGKINMSVFLGDFIQYEVELVTGQVIELNEYTKDVDNIRKDGEEVHISMNTNQVSLYEKESEEVLSC
jgi:iron(III) transport system ATP-binding protein